MIDYILLDEVDKVHVMETEGEELGDITLNPMDGGEEERGQCSFLIKTTQEGHNGGREYYLRVGSAESCQKLVHRLNRAARSAKFRAETHSRFAKSQFAVQQIYDSSYFHYASALLIAAVRTVRLFPSQSFCCSAPNSTALSASLLSTTLPSLPPRIPLSLALRTSRLPSRAYPELRHERPRCAIRTVPEEGRRLAHAAG